MGHTWIIDVLADLENFAQRNQLPMLADELSKTAQLATAEIAKVSEGASFTAHGDAEKLQPILSRAGASRTA